MKEQQIIDGLHLTDNIIKDVWIKNLKNLKRKDKKLNFDYSELVDIKICIASRVWLLESYKGIVIEPFRIGEIKRLIDLREKIEKMKNDLH